MNKVIIVLLSVCFGFLSCTEDEMESPIELSKRPFLSRFWISQDYNLKLSNDYIATIDNDSTFVLFCQELEYADSIVPSFEGNFVSVKVNGQEQLPGISAQDVSNIIRYELTDSVGNIAYYNVKFLFFNKIPRVDVYTKDGANITSKKKYVEATFKISNCPETGAIMTTGKIRGRGNATWGYAKKPYKIKFTEKQSPFGFPANKDWVLLAEACDRTLLRTAYMCETSKAANMDFTVHYQYVDLFLNKEYKGTYILTDQVEKASTRVNIDKDGFFIENDNNYESEPLYFVTERLKLPFTFKYPDADDGDIIEGDERYNYIVSFMNDLEKELMLLKDSPDATAYLSYLDINSFAKWYIVAELTTTCDPNMFYVLTNRNSKLKMYPMWDAEWSLGLWPTGAWGEPSDPLLSDIIWKGRYYFQYLFFSSAFVREVKKEWARLQENIPAIKENIRKITEYISLSQRTNFYRWPDAGGPTLNICFDTWEEEVEYINKAFDERINWMNNYINNII